MVTARLHILYDIGGYLIVSGSWKYLPLLFVMKILAPFQESHSQYFVDIDDNDTVKRSQRLVQTLTYKLTDIYIYCSEIEISKPFVTIFSWWDPIIWDPGRVEHGLSFQRDQGGLVHISKKKTGKIRNKELEELSTCLLDWAFLQSQASWNLSE